MMLSAGRKKTGVWRHFWYDERTRKTTCRILPRGKETECGYSLSGKNTTNLKRHLRQRHPDIAEELQCERENRRHSANEMFSAEVPQGAQKSTLLKWREGVEENTAQRHLGAEGNSHIWGFDGTALPIELMLEPPCRAKDSHPPPQNRYEEEQNSNSNEVSQNSESSQTVKLEQGGSVLLAQSDCRSVGDSRDAANSAVQFWRKCREAGYVQSIFSTFISAMARISERIMLEEASEDDCAISLRVLEASGILPQILAQREKDFHERQQKLQRESEALEKFRSAMSSHHGAGSCAQIQPSSPRAAAGGF
ncbi:uncharacterized protein LOC108920405 isoform X2 [Scleropages formosus]|uniref:uncharacterized protein LOC108920405 isoform X2 n=1 Tax=Scleropages formosus TaxID=113540 RepID=UPI0010FA7A3A|nr:uncharacterized protein LOC108920405 isoform X2 [Scleropages formosus]